MFIEVSDFLIHLNRLGILMVCLAVWRILPELLPEPKRAHWVGIANTVVGKSAELFFSLLFVGAVFYYTIILFFLTTMVLQAIAFYFNIPSNLNFMVILVALLAASMIQIYSMRHISKTGLSFFEKSEQPQDHSANSLRWGTLLFSTGFFLQFLATFG